MKVLNKTDVPVSIKIVSADGKQDTIQLNRGKPVTLPAGYEIDPSMIAQYKAILKTDPPLVAPTPAPVQEEVPAEEADAEGTE
jgi:hypothetical protein